MQDLVVIGHEGCDTRPFFQQHIDQDPVKVGDTQTLLSQHTLPLKLQSMYRFFDNASNEYYVGEWTFMSLNTISTRATSDKLDFALKYIGMGYVSVCAVESVTHRVYERIEGGSNPLSRQDSLKMSHIVPVVTYSFDEWLQTIV